MLRVLSLNSYTFGHITFQNTLEKTFRDNDLGIEFNSYHLTKESRKDLLARGLNLIARRRIPGCAANDGDYFRLRAEWMNSFFGRRALKRILRSIRPDVIHLHTQAIALLSRSLMRQIPTVITIDNTTALLIRDRPNESPRTYRPIVSYEQHCFEAAAHVSSWSQRARRSLIDDYGISEQKTSTIRPAVPLERFFEAARQREPRDSDLRLLFVGNDFLRKGGDLLIRVFTEHFADRGMLDIVSNGEVPPPPHPRVQIHRGIQSDSAALQHLYANAGIFVLPTREDCFPMVFIEAMAAGLPCIGTGVMGVPELVLDGKTGIVIPARDVHALRHAIQTLIDSSELRSRYGAAGRERAQSEFDPVSNCRKLADVFRAVARR